MIVKFFILVASIESVVCSVVPEYYEPSNEQYPSSAHYRDSCLLAVGGICMKAKDCPAGKQSPVRGLCDFMGEGAVCCHSVPKSETRCRRNGGECWPKSLNCAITVERASDCSSEEKCCMLLH